jgi:hypothetical protein
VLVSVLNRLQLCCSSLCICEQPEQDEASAALTAAADAKAEEQAKESKDKEEIAAAKKKATLQRLEEVCVLT